MMCRMPSSAQVHSHTFSPRYSLCYLGREAPSWEVRGPSSLAEFPIY